MLTGTSVPPSSVEYNLKWTTIVYSLDKSEVMRLWELVRVMVAKNVFGYKVPDPLPPTLASTTLELKQECPGIGLCSLLREEGVGPNRSCFLRVGWCCVGCSPFLGAFRW